MLNRLDPAMHLFFKFGVGISAIRCGFDMLIKALIVGNECIHQNILHPMYAEDFGGEVSSHFLQRAHVELISSREESVGLFASETAILATTTVISGISACYLARVALFGKISF